MRAKKIVKEQSHVNLSQRAISIGFHNDHMHKIQRLHCELLDKHWLRLIVHTLVYQVLTSKYQKITIPGTIDPVNFC